MNIEEVYDRVGEKIYHYLIIKLGSQSDAEDVLQETFCRLVRYSFRLKFIRNNKAFVYKIARNEANRFLRNEIQNRKGCQQIAELHEIIRNSISGPDAKAEHLTAQALAQLSEDQREVVVLKIFEGLTFKEIASICDLSINTAASRYRYGIEKLRSLMEGKNGKSE